MKTIATTFLLALGLGISSAASADVWAEREALSKVESEIKAIESLVNDASKIAVEDSRIQFEYDALIRDLRMIRQGIKDHLSQPINPVIPSRIEPVRADYTGVNK